MIHFILAAVGCTICWHISLGVLAFLGEIAKALLLLPRDLARAFTADLRPPPPPKPAKKIDEGEWPMLEPIR